MKRGRPERRSLRNCSPTRRPRRAAGPCGRIAARARHSIASAVGHAPAGDTPTCTHRIIALWTRVPGTRRGQPGQPSTLAPWHTGATRHCVTSRSARAPWHPGTLAPHALSLSRVVALDDTPDAPQSLANPGNRPSSSASYSAHYKPAHINCY